MNDAPDTSRQRPLAKVRALLTNEAVRRRIIAPVAFDAAFLATTLITGVTVARALGADGRGQVTAILLLAQTAGWLFAMGATEAVSYRLSREPSAASRLIGSWLLASVPLTLIAVIASELALPVLFSAQTAHAIDLARVFLFFILMVITQGIFSGVLLGDEDFLYFNVARLLSPLLTAVGYIGVLVAGAFTVESALIVNVGAGLCSLAVAARRSLSRHGIGSFDRDLLRETIWYGFKAHAGNVAGIVNARLDLLVIPAFLSAASIGLYSVATNSTSIISTLTGTVALFVLPVAARQGRHSARSVILTFHAVLGIGVILAIPLAVLAHPVLTLIYGSEFGAATTCLRILLPGSILNAAAIVLYSGLLAANRPFLSSVATIGGLIIFLQSGGIEAAAIVTSVAYTLSFFVSIALYRHVTHLKWRDFVRAPKSAMPASSAPGPGA